MNVFHHDLKAKKTLPQHIAPRLQNSLPNFRLQSHPKQQKS
jgi:hypothetical protein